ncbi:cysteine synthase A [Neptuniibacter sp. CAU 1671]|uniref:cysteine synthase A n=1 Tax=Neptuniibacter sp. CAU 1671 TaxID=3032593 RepID=UPI0023DAAFD0|nr:cysteine synthase A [Neptuniibacter sp. CAU 1671]MDF2180664.1 cysteine synthase A [Neptuniibacter sp. CAU 1671]
MKACNSILDTIGNTPLIRINKLAPEHVNLYVKMEAFNPGGSVKDRLALGIIEDAERKGLLQPGQTVVEATSGNTGIGLAVVCAQKGYPLVVTMAESFSVERRKLMRFLGARVVLTPAALKGTGMVQKARELSEAHGWFLCRQFENEANADIHSATTGPEILEAFEGEPLHYWVSGYGTGGTVKGVARYLSRHSPDTRIIVCEPDNSNLLSSGIKQQHNPDGSAAVSHPSFRPHLMQGWTPDFISKLTDDAIAADWIDQVLPIHGQNALDYAKRLAREEGIFVGITAGATFAGAVEIANNAPAGSNIVCMLPDTGERYLSTPLFEQISEQMTDEELGLSASTPSARFDAPPPAPSATAQTSATDASEAAKTFFNDTIHNKNAAVVVFALEWCEFCWSIKKLFNQCNIPFTSIDLDSATYQDNDFGGDIRRALNAHTGCITIPQVFVNGTFIGGCTETFDAFRAGTLQQSLKALEVEFDETCPLDPYTLLPKWLHPR